MMIISCRGLVSPSEEILWVNERVVLYCVF